MNIRGYRPRLYQIWSKMRDRCNQPRNPHFKHYGGRGIKVCQEWDSYEAFHAWAHANGYSDSLTIDRIDNDGPYAPSNCRWATPKEQARNTRRNLLVTYNGETLPLVAWAERTGLPYAMLRSRFKLGWSAEELVGKVDRTSPPRRRRPAKLTEDDVAAIRASQERGIDLARRYGVSKSLICCIRRGSKRKGLEPYACVSQIKTQGPRNGEANG